MPGSKIPFALLVSCFKTHDQLDQFITTLPSQLFSSVNSRQNVARRCRSGEEVLHGHAGKHTWIPIYSGGTQQRTKHAPMARIVVHSTFHQWSIAAPPGFILRLPLSPHVMVASCFAAVALWTPPSPGRVLIKTSSGFRR